jgi:hypothetical protein
VFSGKIECALFGAYVDNLQKLMGKSTQGIVEIEIEELTRRTDVRLGSTPRRDAPFYKQSLRPWTISLCNLSHSLFGTVL